METGKRVFFHVDLDAFFASVEQLDHPEYRGKPVVVGAAPGRRGVVAACSYEARKFGIHSAMPIQEANRRCPQAVFLPVRMERYQELSCAVMALFLDFTPDVRQMSIDEAFLDMTGTERLFGPPERAARALKAAVRERLGLTISVGVADNRYVAKIASARMKPDGLTIVPPGGNEAFMAALPLEKLWGAGEKTQERFNELGIRTVPDIVRFREEVLKSLMGNALGSFLFRAARGIDPGVFEGEARTKSVSSETTFETDLRDEEAIRSTVLGLCDDVAYRLFRSGETGRTVGIKIRYADFKSVQAQETHARRVFSSGEIFDAAWSLFEKKRDRGQAVRLVGVSVKDVGTDMPVETDLFEDGYEKRNKMESAVFSLRERNRGNVIRARHLRPGCDEAPDTNET